MRRNENLPPRPTADCLSVPLFNQKKRNRLPLTSNPSANEFISRNEYSTTLNSFYSELDTLGCNQASGYPATVSQSHQWNRQSNPQSYQQHCGNRQSPGPLPTVKNHTPLPHPYKSGTTPCSQLGQPKKPVRQHDTPRPTYSSMQSTVAPQTVFPSTGQQSAYGQAKTPPKYPSTPQSLPPPLPPPSRNMAHVLQEHHSSWRFKSPISPGSLRAPVERQSNTHHSQTKSQTSLAFHQTKSQTSPAFHQSKSQTSPAFHQSKSQTSLVFHQTKSQTSPAFHQTKSQTSPAFQMKPVIENSLRILTAVIDGMRHWSQFKDRAPYLFEIFATLDSAVTLGPHGSKNFLLREGKDVVQCVFYENEKELPRLIRGQGHRCVGNYDRTRDVLTCVSVRAALPSEQRNALESVKACDLEMRAMAKSLTEV